MTAPRPPASTSVAKNYAGAAAAPDRRRSRSRPASAWRSAASTAGAAEVLVNLRHRRQPAGRGDGRGVRRSHRRHRERRRLARVARSLRHRQPARGAARGRPRSQQNLAMPFTLADRSGAAGDGRAQVAAARGRSAGSRRSVWSRAGGRAAAGRSVRARTSRAPLALDPALLMLEHPTAGRAPRTRARRWRGHRRAVHEARRLAALVI